MINMLWYGTFIDTYHLFPQHTTFPGATARATDVLFWASTHENVDILPRECYVVENTEEANLPSSPLPTDKADDFDQSTSAKLLMHYQFLANEKLRGCLGSIPSP